MAAHYLAHTMDCRSENTDDVYEIVWKNEEGAALPSHFMPSEGEVLKCRNWPVQTTSLCHNCCHGFTTVPVPLPQAYDEVKRIYYCRGMFCSWNCAKSYNLANTALIGRGDRNAYISLLAYRLWVKYKLEALNARQMSLLDRFSRYNILPSPPKERLRAFGGDVDIEEYRDGFFGIVPPDEAVVGKPFLNLRETIAKETMVLPFVNLSTRSRPTPMITGKASSKPISTHSGSFVAPSSCEKGVTLHTNANEFCSRLNRATANHTAMLKRKRTDSTKNTLMTTMGIVVEKRTK